MDDRKDINLVWLDVIDDPVRSFHDFSDLGRFKLGHHAP